MDDRENLISLIRRKGYERMPVDFSMTPDLAGRFNDYVQECGYEYPSSPFIHIPETKELYPKTQDFWQQFYDVDFKTGTHFDRYGIAGEPGSKECMHMRKMYHPLEKMETLEELKAYPYPILQTSPSDDQHKTVIVAHEAGKFAMGNMACTVWETAWYARGMEALMMDMLTNEELADFLLDTVCNNAVIMAKNYARAGADGIFLGDDIGMQSTIMMSEELYRHFLKPRLKKVIDEAKKIKPDLIVFYHSCGHVTEFISDLLEAGIDVLNPVQPESMNFDEVFLEYGSRLSFCGTIGIQTTMPFGTPEEIKREVKERLDFVGKNGGLLICPTHVLEPEVPIENVIAYIESCKEYIPGR